MAGSPSAPPPAPLAGSRYLGTTYSDSNFGLRKIAALGDALQRAQAGADRKRAEDERREQEEIQEFYRIAAQDPEWARSVAPAMKAKYGDRYPLLNQTVDFFTNPDSERQKAGAATNKFYNTLDGVEQKYSADQQRLASLPDTIDVPQPQLVPSADPHTGLPITQMQMVPVPTPNPAKAELQSQLAGVDPSMFEYVALAQLNPRERAYARLSKATTVSAFDPMSDLPPEQKALYAATHGWLTGQNAQAARIGNRLEQAPATLQEQQYNQGMQTQRIGATAEHDARTRTTGLERIGAQTKASERLIQEREGSSKRMVDYRQAADGDATDGDAQSPAEILGVGRAKGSGHAGGAKVQPLSEYAVSVSKQHITDQVTAAKQAGEVASPNGASSASMARQTAAAEYAKANPRPVQLTAAQAQQIQKAVAAAARAGQITSNADARAAVDLMVEKFSRMTAGGADSAGNPVKPMSSAAALAKVLAPFSGLVSPKAGAPKAAPPPTGKPKPRASATPPPQDEPEDPFADDSDD